MIAGCNDNFTQKKASILKFGMWLFSDFYYLISIDDQEHKIINYFLFLSENIKSNFIKG